MKTLLAAFMLLLASSAVAENDEPLPRPCQTIATACEAAGYHRGGHKEGKGLWKDCVAPILDGRAIPGVTPNPDDVKACQARRPKNRG
ncbi:MAG TPA: hypothetical protein VN947_20695 [Polyangia bacterium]|nr:hypothetical protein [Polyangia bacterium]